MLVVRGYRGCGRELLALVLDVERNLAEPIGVFPTVMRAEEQLAAAAEHDADVGLRTAAITAVSRRQRGRFGKGDCSGHFFSSSSFGPGHQLQPSQQSKQGCASLLVDSVRQILRDLTLSARSLLRNARQKRSVRPAGVSDITGE